MNWLSKLFGTSFAPASLETLREISSEEHIHALFAEDRALLFKHSPICSVSSVAAREMERFVNEHPEITVYVVDVIGNRQLSRGIAERAGVHHESPQVIAFASGKPLWDVSHFEITASGLAKRLLS